MPQSRLNIAVYAASADGKYHGRYPSGNAPTLGGNALDATSGAATLSLSGGTANYLGMNLAPVSQGSPQLAFINIMKTAGNNGPHYTCWLFGNSTSNTGSLQVDGDGYLTSMTDIYGTTYTSIYTNINLSFNSVPNAPTLYPTGNYTLTFTGNGTITIGGDASSISQTASSGSSISGTSLTITDGGTHSMIFSVATASASGLKLSVGGIPTSGSSYPKAIDIRQSIYAPGGSSYNARAIFDPNFKARLAGYSRIRFMDWMQAINSLIEVDFTAALLSGATSGTISSVNSGGSASSTWNQPTRSYQMTVNNATAQVVTATLTNGSANVTFTPALTSTGNVQSSVTLGFIPRIDTWADRPLPTRCCYTELTGVPLEICGQLCNELGVDMWMCEGIMNSSSWWASTATLLVNGTGASPIPVFPGDTPVTFTGLNSPQIVFTELGNENWNSNLGSRWNYCKVLGQVNFPTASVSPGGGFNFSYAAWEFAGVQTALMSDAWYSALGATTFNGRVIASMGGQYTNTAVMLQSLNTPDWSGGAAGGSGHHIGAVHIAPYVGSILYSQATGTIANGSPSIAINNANNQFPAGGQVTFSVSVGTGAGGVVGGSDISTSTPIYYVVTATSTSIQVSTTAGGPTITFNAAGSATISTTADAQQLEAEADPVTGFFALLTSDAYNGKTYPSVQAFQNGANGWLGFTLNQVTDARNHLNSAGYTALPLLGYEGGTSFQLVGKPPQNDTTYLGIITSFHRDARIAAFYQTYLSELLTAGMTNINQFNDVGYIATSGEWCTYESGMQPSSGVNQPPKALGQAEWIN